MGQAPQSMLMPRLANCQPSDPEQDSTKTPQKDIAPNESKRLRQAREAYEVFEKHH